MVRVIVAVLLTRRGVFLPPGRGAGAAAIRVQATPPNPPHHPSLQPSTPQQALIDVVGVVRVIVAVLLAALARVLLRRRGVFYQLAGEQARLIDDVTGTLPPYDQFITLGPLRPQETVEGLSAKLGCGVAVVDVNDLKKVQILAASAGVDHTRLTTALLPNPAGNAEEQTPIVIVRGCSKS
ncbi:unnamed protein product [Closterium sp. NIES-53]